MDRNRIPLYRLPENILPASYKLTLKPCFDTWAKFEAKLECRIKVLEACNEIVLNCCKLNLKDVECKVDNGKIFKTEKILHDEENEIVKLFFGARGILPNGMATLTIKYEGLIQTTRELKGIYLNRWNEKVQEGERFIRGSKDMKDKCWIMSKLDLGQARLAMPCWDEPKFKADFKLEIEIPSDLDCVFNSKKEKEESTANGLKRICFKETPLMSTSSLCFCVGKFDRTIEKPVGGTKIRICLPKMDSRKEETKEDFGRKKEWAHWTLDTACKLMDLFQNRIFTQAKFPVEKLDLMAVPNFAKKATGSLGLIQIREEMFWINEDASPCVKKQKVALLVAKMIAKQWIGNIMTMKNLKEIWFEESMCKFLKYHACDKLWPEWQIWDSGFPRMELLPSMRFDMLPTTDPIEMSEEMMKMWMGTGAGEGKAPVDWLEHNKAGDWDFLEKRVRFSKGCVLLKMMRDFVGEQCLIKALCNFLTKIAFKAPPLDEFWTEIEMECKQTKPNINIRQLIKTWTEKRAFPIVHCTGKVDSTTGNFMITLKQESVIDVIKKRGELGKMETREHHGGSKMEEPKLWWIPLGICTDPSGTQPKMDVLMDKEAISLMVPASEYRNQMGYFKVDPKHSCFMAICYPEEHIRRVLLPMIERRELRDRMDRAGLLLDVYKCTKVGLYPTDLCLELVRKLMETEDSVTVWRCMMECVFELRKCCADWDFYKKDTAKQMVDKFNRFVVTILKDKKDKMDDRWWLTSTKGTRASRKSDDDEMLMGMWARMMVEFRDKDVERKAVETFWAWFHHEPEREGKMIAGDMQKACFAAAAQSNDMKVCDAFIKIYKDYKFEEAREYVLHGIGFFTDRNIVDKLMNFAISEEVPSEDTLRMIKSLTRRFPETRETAWRDMKAKWDFFTSNFDRCRMGSNFFERFITEFCDGKMAEEVAKFAREKIPIRSCTRMLHQSTEYAQLKECWFRRDAETIKRYLDKF